MKAGPSTSSTARPGAISLPEAGSNAPATPAARRVPAATGLAATRASGATAAPSRARPPARAGRTEPAVPAIGPPLARIARHIDAEVIAPMSALSAELDRRYVESQTRLVELIEAVGEIEADRATRLQILAELEKRSPDVMLREVEDGAGLASRIDGALASIAGRGVAVDAGRRALAPAVRALHVAWTAWLAPLALSVPMSAPPFADRSIGDALEACFNHAAMRRRDLIVALQGLRALCRDAVPELGNAMEAHWGFHLWLEVVACNIGLKCNDLRDRLEETHVRLVDACKPGHPRALRDQARDAELLTLGALKRARLAALARWSIESTSLHDDRGGSRAHAVVARSFADAAMTHADVMLWHVGSGRGVAAHLDLEEMDFLEELAFRAKRTALQVENLLLEGDATRHANAIEALMTVLVDEIEELCGDLHDACHVLLPRAESLAGDGDEGRLLPDTLRYLLDLFRPLQLDLPKTCPARAGSPPLPDDLREELGRAFKETLGGVPLGVGELSARAASAVEARHRLAFARREEDARRAMAQLLLDEERTPPPSATAAKRRSAKKAKWRTGARRTHEAKSASPEREAPVAVPAARSVTREEAAARHHAARQSIARAMDDARDGRRWSDAIRQLPRVEQALREWLDRVRADAMAPTDRARLSEDCAQLRTTQAEIDQHFRSHRLLSGPTMALFQDPALRARIEVRPGIRHVQLAAVSFFGAEREPDEFMEIELFLRPKAAPAAELPAPPLEPVSGRFWLHVHSRASAHFKNDHERTLSWRQGRNGEFLAVHRGPVLPGVAKEIQRLAESGTTL